MGTQTGVAILSSDDLRFLLIDDETNQTIHREVFATYANLLRRRLELARPLTFIDATNLTRRSAGRISKWRGCMTAIRRQSSSIVR